MSVLESATRIRILLSRLGSGLGSSGGLDPVSLKGTDQDPVSLKQFFTIQIQDIYTAVIIKIPRFFFVRNNWLPGVRLYCDLWPVLDLHTLKNNCDSGKINRQLALKRIFCNIKEKLSLQNVHILSVPNITAIIYCKSRNLPNADVRN